MNNKLLAAWLDETASAVLTAARQGHTNPLADVKMALMLYIKPYIDEAKVKEAFLKRLEDQKKALQEEIYSLQTE